MRRPLTVLSALAFATAAAWAPGLAAREAVVLAPASVQSAPAEQLACKGCGCRGGPGYRLPNGKCASRRG